MPTDHTPGLDNYLRNRVNGYQHSQREKHMSRLKQIITSIRKIWKTNVLWGIKYCDLCIKTFFEPFSKYLPNIY